MKCRKHNVVLRAVGKGKFKCDRCGRVYSRDDPKRPRGNDQ